MAQEIVGFLRRLIPAGHSGDGYGRLADGGPELAGYTRETLAVPSGRNLTLGTHRSCLPPVPG
jgi:hypothetical protein